MVGSGLLWPDLGMSRIANITPSSGDPPSHRNPHRRRLSGDARSRNGHHPRRRVARLEFAAALFVGAGCVQGQGQFANALPGNRYRHRRLAGVVPYDPVCGERQCHVSRRCRAWLGGSHLYRGRFRLLGQGVRYVVGLRAHLARFRRSNSGRDPSGLSVRLFEFEPLACALRAHHRRLARFSGRACRRRPLFAASCFRHRAHLAVLLPCLASRWCSICRRMASTAR